MRCAHDVDDFVEVFNERIFYCVVCSTIIQMRRKRDTPNLPRWITIRIIHRKHTVWRRGKVSGDMSRNEARKATFVIFMVYVKNH